MRGVWAAIAAGGVVGVLARDLPAELALVMFSGRAGADCGMEEVLRCAVETVPRAIGDLIVIGLTMAAIALVGALLGLLALAVGIDRFRRSQHPPPQRAAAIAGGPPHPPPGVSPWPGLVLVGLGVSLLVPAGWLAVSFVLFLV